MGNILENHQNYMNFQYVFVVTPHALVTLVHIDLHFSSSIMPACRQVKQLEEEMAQTGHIPLAAQAEMLY